jgi:formamidopyrimidine-DNA glycosylase
MPELPEVEHLRLSLAPRLLGRGVRSVRIHRRDVVVAPGDPPGGFSRASHTQRPRRLGPAALLAGTTVAELRRRGKQLAIIGADGRVVCVHLGMSGQLRLLPGSDRQVAPHEHITWRLDNGTRLVFRDPRRFGGVWTFPSVADLERQRWACLGPDALTVTAGQLRASLCGVRRAVKAALLDQSVIAGVGNIYADEALFAAGVSPLRQALGVESDEVAKIAGAIRRVMAASIAAGGSTLRDYRDAEGNKGNNQFHLTVYGRGGEPCPGCGRALRQLRLAQRATVMCDRCQM